jgi:hypothetical protein
MQYSPQKLPLIRFRRICYDKYLPTEDRQSPHVTAGQAARTWVASRA